MENLQNDPIHKQEIIKKMKVINFGFIIYFLFSFSLRCEESFNWGVASNNNSSIHLQKALKKFRKKRDVIVAVIDTGIDPTHPHLKNNIHVVSGPMNLNNFGIDFSKGQHTLNRPFDDHGHGTHIAGIIKSIFSDVRILSLKYYNPRASGEDNLNSTINALRFAIHNNVDIINYSGGGPEASQEEYELLKLANKKGILVVAAAGNEESNIDQKKSYYYPASYGLDNIITVTAHDFKLAILPSSNYGQKSVDVSAPGDKIRSSLPHGRMGNLTGTSQATAFVTGVAALIKSQYPELSGQSLKYLIKNSSQLHKKIKGFCASGILNAEKAMKLAQSYNKESIKIKRNLAQNTIPINRSQFSLGKIIYRKSTSNQEFISP